MTSLLPRTALLALLLMVVASPEPASGNDTEGGAAVLTEFLYSAERDSDRELQDARSAALAEGKLLLVAFGAQWCHDSRGLSRNFSDPALLPLLEERFAMVFVDLGYYDQGGELFRSFGMPVYFGTPTVLVIDPVTNTVLNEDTLSVWQAADSVPMGEYKRYFTGEFSQPTTDDPQVAASLAAIRSWERQQAERLYAGYATIGPMLAAEAAGNPPAEINTVWGEVRDFRVQLQRDLVTLRASARSGQDFTGDVAWPRYPAFSWES